jgi:hypothetical protein
MFWAAFDAISFHMSSSWCRDSGTLPQDTGFIQTGLWTTSLLRALRRAPRIAKHAPPLPVADTWLVMLYQDADDKTWRISMWI